MFPQYKKISLLSCFVILCAFTALTSYLKKLDPITMPAGRSFAVVELFTSEGCSSCPPADAAVSSIAQEFAGKIFVLGFHVDYWDRLGWKDKYSDAAYTSRQRHYAELFSLHSIYTPQVIVNGATEFVGSNEGRLRSTVVAAIKKTSPVSLILRAAKANDHSVAVSYKTTNGTKAILNIALVQLKATSAVKRGENSGRTLHHINIVRNFTSLPVDKNATGTVTVIIPNDLTPHEYKVIGYLQNSTDWQVLAAGDTTI